MITGDGITVLEGEAKCAASTPLSEERLADFSWSWRNPSLWFLLPPQSLVAFVDIQVVYNIAGSTVAVPYTDTFGGWKICPQQMEPLNECKVSSVLYENKNCPSKGRSSKTCWLSEVIPEFCNQEALLIFIAEAITQEVSATSSAHWSGHQVVVYQEEVLNSSQASSSSLSVNSDIQNHI